MRGAGRVDSNFTCGNRGARRCRPGIRAIIPKRVCCVRCTTDAALASNDDSTREGKGTSGSGSSAAHTYRFSKSHIAREAPVRQTLWWPAATAKPTSGVTRRLCGMNRAVRILRLHTCLSRSLLAPLPLSPTPLHHKTLASLTPLRNSPLVSSRRVFSSIRGCRPLSETRPLPSPPSSPRHHSTSLPGVRGTLHTLFLCAAAAVAATLDNNEEDDRYTFLSLFLRPFSD